MIRIAPFLLASTLIHAHVFANESAATSETSVRGRVDLGSVEIKGELRRPSLSWIDANGSLKGELSKYHRELFLKIERELLTPVSAAQFANKEGLK